MKLYAVIDSTPDYDGDHDEMVGIFDNTRDAIQNLFLAKGELSYINVVNVNEVIDEGTPFMTRRHLEDVLKESERHLQTL